MEYCGHYNGVDRKDRDTADWSVALKSNRWYMRVVYWLVDSSVFAMYITVKMLAEEDDDVWRQYTGKDGREKFQWDLGHALIECGIKLDLEKKGLTVADLKDPKKRPAYMPRREKEFCPCECGICFFCKNGLTRGLAHAQGPGLPVFKTNEHLPPSPQVPPPPPSQHNKDRVHLGKTRPGYCVVCLKKAKAKYPDKTQDELRKMKGLIRQSMKGCLQCNNQRGIAICKDCWKNH